MIAVLGKVANDTLDLTDMYYSGVPSLYKSAQHQRAANASTYVVFILNFYLLAVISASTFCICGL